MTYQIRVAKEEDASELLTIYGPYVLETAITFDYEVPELDAFRQKMLAIQSRYPFLVIQEGNKILGYAYASAFKDRKAYDWSCEVTIYLAKEARGKGIGPKLYQKLEACLQAMGILNLNACIAYAAKESEYLTNRSQVFHEKLGYELVGTFHKSGYKFQEWFDMIWMEKLIGEHESDVSDIISFKEINADDILRD